MLEYKKQYYVERRDALTKVQQWIDSGEGERVFSIIAPPGSGKTWFLRRIKDESTENGRFVIWIDSPILIDRNETQDQKRMIDRDAFDNWFDEIENEAHKHSIAIPPIGPTVHPEQKLQTLARNLCSASINPLIIMVDGYDEINDQQAQAFSLRILENLYGGACTLIIVAHRAKHKLHGNNLCRNQHRFFLNQEDKPSRDFAIRQFENWFHAQYPDQSMPDLTSWMARMDEYYHWNHPFINHFLFIRSLDSSQVLKEITDQDLYECVQQAISRPDARGQTRYSRLTKDEFCFIHGASRLGERFSQQQIESEFHIRIWDDPKVLKFFDQGLIIPSINSSFYQIPDGIREILQKIDLSQIEFV